MVRPWPTLSSRPLGDFRIFTLRADVKINPRTNQEHDFYVIDCVNWVNVLAITPERNVVMVEQYRHGSNTVELEIPGGIMDQTDSSPVATGVRELREETGYAGENARILGEVFANPAIMSNKCFTVLIDNCTPQHTTQLDSGEDLATRLVPMDELQNLLATGRIRHSLVIVALYYFELWQKKIAPPGMTPLPPL